MDSPFVIEGGLVVKLRGYQTTFLCKGCVSKKTGDIFVVPANSVPAAAVIRGGQALFVMIGRTEHSDDSFYRKSIVGERKAVSLVL
jgi:hypothetical protein